MANIATTEEIKKMLEEHGIMMLDAIRTIINEKHEHPKPYTRKEFCETFGIDKTTFHNWAKNGKLHTTYLGSRVYVESEEVERLLKQGGKYVRR